MTMIIYNTEIMPDSSEVVHYDEPGLSLYIEEDSLSNYPALRAAAHWHEDLEFMLIEEGEMNYSINGETIPLKEGDVLFVNARQLHFGFDEEKKPCRFLCVLVHPSLLKHGSSLLSDQLSPMLEDASFPWYLFSGSDRNQLSGGSDRNCFFTGSDTDHFFTGSGQNHSGQYEQDCYSIRTQLQHIGSLKAAHPYGYELQITGLLTEMAGIILSLWHEEKISATESGSGWEIPAAAKADPQLDLQRRMVAFVEENYYSDLSLDDIAQNASVSRSTCCRLFRKYVNMSPIDFLNSYRLQVAGSLLETTDLPVTQIASRCGFNHASYFSELFRKSYGCTPMAYRIQLRPANQVS